MEGRKKYTLNGWKKPPTKLFCLMQTLFHWNFNLLSGSLFFCWWNIFSLKNPNFIHRIFFRNITESCVFDFHVHVPIKKLHNFGAFGCCCLFVRLEHGCVTVRDTQVSFMMTCNWCEAPKKK